MGYEAAKLARKKWLHVVAVTIAVLVGVHTSVWTAGLKKATVFAGVHITISIVCGAASVVEELWANSSPERSSPTAWRSAGLAAALTLLGSLCAMVLSILVFNST